MAKGVYIGIGDKAKKVKAMYVGIGGVAKKVKKAYIGVNDVARLFFSFGVPKRYGNATDLAEAVYDMGGASVGNYALFTGGHRKGGAGSNSNRASVDTYNSSLTKGLATDLSSKRSGVGGASVGSYALFVGGRTVSDSGSTADQYVAEAYDASLTKKSATRLPSSANAPKTATVGNYALFSLVGSTILYAYDSSLTLSTPTALANKVYSDTGAAMVDGYAIFAGDPTQPVTAYNASLTRSTADATGGENTKYACASTGNYALFAGGCYDDDGDDRHQTTVVTYNSSLTRSTATALSTSRSGASGVRLGDYAVIAGGYRGTSSTTYSAVVDMYDASLTRSTLTSLASTKALMTVATVGDYALFAGGRTGSSSSTVAATVDAYVLA